MSFDREAVRARRETAIAELNAIDYRNDAGLAEWVRTWTHIVCLDLPAAMDEIERLERVCEAAKGLVDNRFETGAVLRTYIAELDAALAALEGRE